MRDILFVTEYIKHVVTPVFVLLLDDNANRWFFSQFNNYYICFIDFRPESYFLHIKRSHRPAIINIIISGCRPFTNLILSQRRRIDKQHPEHSWKIKLDKLPILLKKPFFYNFSQFFIILKLSTFHALLKYPCLYISDHRETLLFQETRSAGNLLGTCHTLSLLTQVLL